MKYFDLSLPKDAGEKHPKVHQVPNERFKKALSVFPRPLAERLVELGYGKWIGTTIEGNIPVPHSFLYPEQILFVAGPTHAVKACHVNALVDGIGPVPPDLPSFCAHLEADAAFQHDPAEQDDNHPDLLGDPEDDFETVGEEEVELDEEDEEVKPEVPEGNDSLEAAIKAAADAPTTPGPELEEKPAPSEPADPAVNKVAADKEKVKKARAKAEKERKEADEAAAAAEKEEAEAVEAEEELKEAEVEEEKGPGKPKAGKDA